MLPGVSLLCSPFTRTFPTIPSTARNTVSAQVCPVFVVCLYSGSRGRWPPLHDGKQLRWVMVDKKTKSGSFSETKSFLKR